ncbi:hypothetical protein A3G67_03890 [Candidatus Roizmanbacteria bacterium RIFCSPLOWO2_12_FULL_40_12]|uniref:Uncharacterized protein n=1 Tax=Candidatus Roizmanbacteria bacterium RIFCSPLOWO2_01_FULL_40_42 TaxID=1802066 RepID=A0A1F7J5S4_9BACT|nr:MAG: hypothetical protein A2779_03525 [Candidatus Roizmanbacteria bacterium RIFCSPHIGHO2_01_FULL_40_98]OGK28405.1 MAG: hypothetical protein A3C31_00890 [Candidatus Roizmanbacteria bacterium RIFCSPHIGHO2_02_FULL_40_53]OGK30641.1 MAG: hypothetical protein A2W49_03575 [Candidatus Roizmanbacteria bacterium RIFCSPHIGHO2_12_41_18]OGK35969.1 MAG: hypothetical protein A3E69_03260 [Candidatus Roizmanbacteria bacterium RIFCSPHIGHO2_12_FULL_40_130]OGK50961.1 MAG: hypothetical protein A3B50_01660 [Candi
MSVENKSPAVRFGETVGGGAMRLFAPTVFQENRGEINKVEDESNRYLLNESQNAAHVGEGVSILFFSTGHWVSGIVIYMLGRTSNLAGQTIARRMVRRQDKREASVMSRCGVG